MIPLLLSLDANYKRLFKRNDYAIPKSNNFHVFFEWTINGNADILSFQFLEQHIWRKDTSER